MAETFEEAIREIKQRADIGAVIGRSVKLKRSGRSLVGLCPFHNEKSPSFYVHPNDGFFKCFGCDAKGDVFSFLERSTGQNFIDIARGLADETGVEIPDDRRSAGDKARSQERDRAMRAAELAQRYFRQCLRTDEGKPGLHYLKQVRGLSDEEIDRWAIGYGGTTPDGFINFLKTEGVTLVDARNAGVIASGKHGEYSFYRSRVTFPIRNRAGKVLAFGGRALGDRGPKYVNGPQTLIYDKSRDLYGLFEALPEMRRGKAGVFVEGYFDVVALGRAGYAAGLSPCGTSLTTRHIQTVSRYTDQIVLCLDSDSAGMKGTERALLLLLQAGMKVSLAELLHKDPDDYVKADQADGLLRTIEGAKDAFEALVDRAVDKSAGSPQRRLRAVEALLPFLAAPKDALTKSHYLRYVADNLRSEMDILREAVANRGVAALQKLTRGQSSPSSGPTNRPPPPRPSPPPPSLPPQSPRSPNVTTSKDAPAKAATGRPPPPALAPQSNMTPVASRDAVSSSAPAPGSNRPTRRLSATDQFDGHDLPDLMGPDDDVIDEALLREARDFDEWEPAAESNAASPRASASNSDRPSAEASDRHGEEPDDDTAPSKTEDHDQSPRHVERESSEAYDRHPDQFDDEDRNVDVGRPRREPSQWRTAEKAIARALLCHPHLAHKAAILVPALRNWELATFISQLDHLVISNVSGTPMDALAQVQIPDSGTFPQLLREIFVARGKAASDPFMTEDAACRFIEDFVQTLDEVEVRRALGEIQRAMRNADERSDMENWKRLQTQQQELVRLLRDVSAGLDKKPPPPPTPPALKAAVDAPALPPAPAGALQAMADKTASTQPAPSTPDSTHSAAPHGVGDGNVNNDKPRLGAPDERKTQGESAQPSGPPPLRRPNHDDDLDDDEMFDF